jgi:hypothetical protein
LFSIQGTYIFKLKRFYFKSAILCLHKYDRCLSINVCKEQEQDMQYQKLESQHHLMMK